MSDERVFSDAIKALGDQIMGMTLKDAKELSDYLKDVYGVEPAAGGAVMVAGPAAGADAAPAAEEKTEFNVVLKEVGANKIGVIKVVKEVTGLGLVESKAMAEAGKVIKENVPKEEADKIVAQFKEAGATAVAE